MSDNKLPEWPDRGELQPMSPSLADLAASHILYERALKEAYAERLKLAMEALERMSYGDHPAIAKEALAAIGTLPGDGK